MRNLGCTVNVYLKSYPELGLYNTCMFPIKTGYYPGNTGFKYDSASTIVVSWPYCYLSGFLNAELGGLPHEILIHDTFILLIQATFSLLKIDDVNMKICTRHLRTAHDSMLSSRNAVGFPLDPGCPKQ